MVRTAVVPLNALTGGVLHRSLQDKSADNTTITITNAPLHRLQARNILEKYIRVLWNLLKRGTPNFEAWG